MVRLQFELGIQLALEDWCHDGCFERGFISVIVCFAWAIVWVMYILYWIELQLQNPPIQLGFLTYRIG